MLGSYRREATAKIWFGNKTQRMEGIRDLTYLLSLLALGGFSKDWLTDWLLERDPQAEEIWFDQLFKLMQVSRYTLWQARNRSTDSVVGNAMATGTNTFKNLKSVAADMVLPPMVLITRPATDIGRWLEAKRTGKPMDYWGAESVQFIPGVGQPMYWKGATGQGKIERRQKLRNAQKKRRDGL
jgi:hypothetical protein